jgi:tyrosinase
MVLFFIYVKQQIVYEHVQKIAASFPPESRARYQKAAMQFRLPYWDWAKQPAQGETNYPTFVGSERKAKVITPTSGNQYVEIDNPLYSYKFKELNPTPGDFIITKGAQVSRYSP